MVNLITNNIQKKIEVSANSSGAAEVSIPTDAVASLAAIGYDNVANSTYRLSTGTASFPNRSVQEGTLTVPARFEPPVPCKSGGTVRLFIVNNNDVAKSYNVFFTILADRTLDDESEGDSLTQRELSNPIDANQDVFQSGSTATNPTVNGSTITTVDDGDVFYCIAAIAGGSTSTATTAIVYFAPQIAPISGSASSGTGVATYTSSEFTPAYCDSVKFQCTGTAGSYPRNLYASSVFTYEDDTTDSTSYSQVFNSGGPNIVGMENPNPSKKVKKITATTGGWSSNAQVSNVCFVGTAIALASITSNWSDNVAVSFPTPLKIDGPVYVRAIGVSYGLDIGTKSYAGVVQGYVQG